jgi:mycothiol synthase
VPVVALGLVRPRILPAVTIPAARIPVLPPDAAWTDRLQAFVARAHDRGDLSGSSDPHAEYLVEQLVAEPADNRIAVHGDEVVGLVATDVKALVVAPAWRRQGIGRRLAGAGLDIELARGRGLVLGPPPGSDGALVFLRATGFAFHSALFELELPADRSLPPPAWPPGLAPRPVDAARDLAPFVALWNAAFAGHATPMISTERSIARWWREHPEELPHMLVVEPVDEPTALAGLCVTTPRAREGWVAGGEIAFVAVAPRRQGQGLGSSLLAWGIGHLREAGGGPVELSVNAHQQTALRLYERAGFLLTGTRERWERRA